MISTTDLIAKFRYALDNVWGYIYGRAGILWTKALQDNVSDEMAKKYGKKWIGHYVADCSGLFAWAFKQLGGYMYHGSNTMYLKYCTDKGKLNKGKREDGKELLPGTAVFVWNEEKKKYSHVGLYIGGNEVIEAKGTINGVVLSMVTEKKWTHWGELKGVNYYGEQPEPQPEKLPTLRKGDRGEYVTLAQTKLVARGYDVGSASIDGIFGSATEKAVKQFQTDWNLKIDGIIGSQTWEYLNSTPSVVTYTITIRELTKSQVDELEQKYPNSSVVQERG